MVPDLLQKNILSTAYLLYPTSVKIYCSGIGGIGLSAYASLQMANGHAVSGSDRAASVVTDDLLRSGIHVAFDQSGAGLAGDEDLFVYSEALPDDAPERRRAKELGIRSLSYPEAVGELTKGFQLIAVCGSHGKSSTTAMAARILINAGVDPTIIVGTRLQELNGKNWRRGASTVFLLEACEYRRSFLNYSPVTILLTNAEPDHLDYFSSGQDYEDAFKEFVAKLPQNGTLILHKSDAPSARIATSAAAKVIDADTEEFAQLSTPGIHMQRNAQLVQALAREFGIDPFAGNVDLQGYSGSWRRMEFLGKTKEGITVIDDYGHHPTEVRATLQALRQSFPKARVVCVFQPHTHHRTLALYDEFTKAFSNCDVLLIPNVYDARSNIENGAVDLEKFAVDISKNSGCEVHWTKNLQETEDHLRASVLTSGDVLICMGAGDITKLAHALVP